MSTRPVGNKYDIAFIRSDLEIELREFRIDDWVKVFRLPIFANIYFVSGI
jgi:hypothetical protein